MARIIYDSYEPQERYKTLCQGVINGSVKVDIAGFYDVKRGKITLLLDRINGCPEVFYNGRVTQFRYEPKNSGTMALRARIEAQLFFDQIESKA